MPPSGPNSVVPFAPLSGLSVDVLEKLEAIRREHDDLDHTLQDSDVLADHKRVRTLSMKKAAIAPVAQAVATFERLAKEIEDLDAAAGGGDREFAALAKEELPA